MFSNDLALTPFFATVKPGMGANPSPNKYHVRQDLFKNEMEKGKGSSFGLGRSQMQLVDHDRDIKYLRGNPSPSKYSPQHIGKELSKDSVKYTF